MLNCELSLWKSIDLKSFLSKANFFLSFFSGTKHFLICCYEDVFFTYTKTSRIRFIRSFSEKPRTGLCFTKNKVKALTNHMRTLLVITFHFICKSKIAFHLLYLLNRIKYSTSTVKELHKYIFIFSVDWNAKYQNT